MSIRKLFSAAALSVDGIGMGHDKATADRYAELIAPLELEGADLQRAMTRMWGCALTRAGIERLVAVNEQIEIDPILWHKYVIGAAMQWEQLIAEHKDAWCTTATTDDLPGEGDAVIVGPNGFHILTIASEPGGAAFFDTIEGGQNDGAGMCIRKLSRRFIRAGALYCGHDPSPATKVYGWINCTKLAPQQPTGGDRDLGSTDADKPASASA